MYLQGLTIFVIVICNQCNQCYGKVLKESIFELGPKLYKFYSDADPEEGVPENFIASPLGLTLGLGLINLGASQNLKQLILDEIFDWQGAEVDFHSNIGTILQLLKSTYSHNKVEDQKEEQPKSKELKVQPVKNLEDVEVNIHCAIFHQNGTQLTPDFHRMAVNHYDSQFIALNKSSSGEEQQMIINQWARNATKDLIQEFPVPRTFSVLLANTVYFEGDWVEPFAMEYTRMGEFQPTNSTKHIMQIPFMLGQQDVPYYESDILKMIRLSYVVRNNSLQDIAMFVVLPKVNDISLNDVIANMTFGHFRDIVKEKMVEWTVNIKLPKLSASKRLNIKRVMDHYFLKDRNNRRWARDVRQTPIDDYHLSSASRNRDFILTDFIQDTVLEVNEKGTRAASISGGYINYDSLSKQFRCDRPYLMIIYDLKNDIVLFWSAIHRPVVNK